MNRNRRPAPWCILHRPGGVLHRRRLPSDGFQALLLEPVVALREVVVAEPSATVGGERGWVYALQDEVLGGVDELLLRAGWASPEEEDDVWAVLRDGLYDGIGECLPALA